LIDAFLKSFKATGPYHSRLSSNLLTGELRLDLPVPKVGDVQAKFDKRSANWVRTRTEKGQGVGLHEPGLVTSMVVLRQLLGPMTDGDFFDIGSLHGYVGVLAGPILGPRRTFLFEMNPQAAEIARANAALNKNSQTEITVFNVGVSNETAEAVPCLYKDFALVVRPDVAKVTELTGENFRKANIDLVTLDTISETRGLRPKMIKIDVEGSQMSILRGADKTLQDFAPVLLIEGDAPGASNSDGTPMARLCLHLMQTYGYQIVAMNHRAWNSAPVHLTQAQVESETAKLDRNQLFVCLPSN